MHNKLNVYWMSKRCSTFPHTLPPKHWKWVWLNSSSICLLPPGLAQHSFTSLIQPWANLACIVGLCMCLMTECTTKWLTTSRKELFWATTNQWQCHTMQLKVANLSLLSYKAILSKWRVAGGHYKGPIS